jgi:hypothetical protein
MFLLVNQTNFPITNVWLAKHGTNAWFRVTYKANQVTYDSNDSKWELFDLKIGYGNKKTETFNQGGFVTDVKRITLSVVNSNKWQAYYEQ